jgi:hypothetical protein
MGAGCQQWISGVQSEFPPAGLKISSEESPKNTRIAFGANLT